MALRMQLKKRSGISYAVKKCPVPRSYDKNNEGGNQKMDGMVN